MRRGFTKNQQCTECLAINSNWAFGSKKPTCDQCGEPLEVDEFNACHDLTNDWRYRRPSMTASWATVLSHRDYILMMREQNRWKDQKQMEAMQDFIQQIRQENDH